MPFSEEEKKIRAREACRRWRLRNLERERQRYAEYFKNNREKVGLKNQRWREQNRERYNELCNQAYHRTKNNNTQTNSVQQKLYKGARTRALKKGLEFNITAADIIVPDVCPVFKTPFYKKDKIEDHVRGKANPRSPSLDRINPKIGYVKGNIQVLSYRANVLKNDATIEEIEQLLAFMKLENQVV